MDYQLLPADDRPQVLEDKSTKDIQRGSDRLSWAAIFVCIICTAINLLSTWSQSSSRPYTFPSATSFISTRGMTRKDIDRLRRPSQFIGLDKIHRNVTQTSDTKSFVNFPMFMAHIDASQPYKVSKPRKGVQTSIGTVYPELSNMLASSSVSTILQFRALDYGMELCELGITIPMTDNAHPLVLPSSPIRIYNIDHKKPLYADSLSYNNRPRRGELIGEPFLERNSTWNHTFTCLRDEIYTFEVACKDFQTGECILKWTQDKDHGSFPAILMTQFSTI